jgi:uncharacterized protein (DUF58 family)
LPVTKRLGVHPWGGELSRLLGPGVEYADVREYQPGEDARQIDWNLTARSDRPYVRESHPDKGVDAWLLVDASASMDWGTALCLKRDSARELISALTLLLTRYGNRVGAVTFDIRVRRVLPPATGRSGRLRLLAQLDRSLAAQSDGGATDLGTALGFTRRLIRRDSLVIVVGDLISAAPWQRQMRALALTSEVVVARITDPREGELPPIGVVTFEDPETSVQFEVDTSSARLRARFREKAAEQRRQIAGDVLRAGASMLEFSTDQPLLPQLVAHLRRTESERRLPPRGRSA